MGLLDGFLGESAEDPRTLAVLRMASALGNQRGRGLGGLLGGATQGGEAIIQTMMQAKQQEEERKRRALQEQMMMQQIEGAKQQRQQQAEQTAQAQRQQMRDEQFAQSLASAGSVSPLAALAGGGGPTVGNASVIGAPRAIDWAGFARANPDKIDLIGKLAGAQNFGREKVTYQDATDESGRPVKRPVTEFGDVRGGDLRQWKAPPSQVQEYEFGKTDPGFNDWLLRGKKAGATSVNVKTETKTGESLAGQIGPILKGTREQALAGLRLVDSSSRIADAVESKMGAFAGPLADTRLKIAQVADVLGVAGKSTSEKIANTRAAIRGLAEQAVAARSQMGGQAQISNAEQALITKATSAEISDVTINEIRQLSELSDRLGRQMYGLHAAQLGAMGQRDDLKGLVPFYKVPEMPGARKKGATESGGRVTFLGFE